MNTGEYLQVYPYQWWTSPRCDPSLPARKCGTHRQACRGVTCKPRKNCCAKFAIGNGIIQYDRPQFLQNLDGTTSGFFDSAQEVLVQ